MLSVHFKQLLACKYLPAKGLAAPLAPAPPSAAKGLAAAAAGGLEVLLLLAVAVALRLVLLLLVGAAQGLGKACVFREFSGTLSTFNSLAKRWLLASSDEDEPPRLKADSMGL